MIEKYKKKPVIIEAVHLTKETAMSYFKNKKLIFNKFSVSGSYHLKDNIVNDAYIMIDTLEGKMRCSLNDYLIKGIQGEFYPCKPDIFKQTYELVK